MTSPRTNVTHSLVASLQLKCKSANDLAYDLWCSGTCNRVCKEEKRSHWVATRFQLQMTKKQWWWSLEPPRWVSSPARSLGPSAVHNQIPTALWRHFVLKINKITIFLSSSMKKSQRLSDEEIHRFWQRKDLWLRDDWYEINVVSVLNVFFFGPHF